jgi:hypothetical protein
LDNITAKAGGNQQPSSPLNASITLHRIVTVASPNDSVTLPPSKGGAFYIITNAHASNSANVFPNTGDAINTLGANNAFALAAGKVALFFCVTAGQWHSLTTA